MSDSLSFKPEEFSLITVFKLIRLNLKFFISFIVILCIIVAAYSFIMPFTYSSNTSILPPKKESNGGLSSYLQSVAGNLDFGGMGQSEQSKLFYSILSSRAVCEYIIDSLRLKDRPEFKNFNDDKLYKFVSNLISTESDKAGVIYISATCQTGFFPSSEEKLETAKFAAQIAKYAVLGLDYIVRERNLSSAHQSKEYIESQLITYREKLDSISNKMEDFQKENKVISLDEQAKAIVTQAIELGTQLTKSELEYNLAKMEFSNESPRLKFYQEQVNLLNDQYNKIQSGGITGNDAFSIPLDSIPTLMKDYADLYRQRKIYEQVIMYLETQHHQEAIQEKRDIPIVEVLDKARIPDERSSPNRVAMLTVTFILANILATFIIIIKSFYKGKTYILGSSN